jgi:hypothetical protein
VAGFGKAGWRAAGLAAGLAAGDGAGLAAAGMIGAGDGLTATAGESAGRVGWAAPATSSGATTEVAGTTEGVPRDGDAQAAATQMAAATATVAPLRMASLLGTSGPPAGDALRVVGRPAGLRRPKVRVVARLIAVHLNWRARVADVSARAVAAHPFALRAARGREDQEPGQEHEGQQPFHARFPQHQWSCGPITMP